MKSQRVDEVFITILPTFDMREIMTYV